MKNILVSPSILSANFAKLGDECLSVVKCGADCIHFDVMDNNFVPNLSFGPFICKDLRNYGINVPIDVHLMTKNPDSLIELAANCGASSITIHPETTQHLDRSISLIKSYNCKAGIALNPTTSIDVLKYIIDKLDIILIMSVNPGFGGQKFIDYSLNKIKEIRQLIDNTGNNIVLSVDGGVNADTICAIKQAGADLVVAGSYIFSSNDYAASISKLKI